MVVDKKLDLNAVWRVVEKLKESVWRSGVNLYDHFKRFDPTDQQMISEYYFRKVLETKLKKYVALSADEVSVLSDYFQYRDGRIMYVELCDRVHHRSVWLSTDIKSNLVTGLEWEDPLRVNTLEPEDQAHLSLLLAHVASVLVKSDHPIDVHFKEYEQIARNPGCVSLEHLARILKAMSVHLDQTSFNLLVKRYVRHNFMFNYVPFLHEIDSAIKCYVARPFDTDIRYVVKCHREKVRRPDIDYPKSETRGKESGWPVTFRLLSSNEIPQEGPHATIKRIKIHLYNNGIDLYKVFRDIDKRLTGRVTKEQFKIALCNARINSGLTGKLILREEDVDELTRIYAEPGHRDSFMWKLLCSDVGMVKSDINNESYSEDSDLRFLPAQGNRWSITPEPVRIKCEETLAKVRTYVKSKRWLLKPFFAEWDVGNNGHVNFIFFRNVLLSNNLVKDIDEFEALESRYGDAKGIDYVRFLNEMQCDGGGGGSTKKSPEKQTPVELIHEECYEKSYTDDEIADAVRNIRRQIVLNSRTLEQCFKQFDPLNKRTVSRQEFLSVLGCNDIRFTLDESEILCRVFKAPLETHAVHYFRFLEMINEAYTQNLLYRSPLIVPVKHISVVDDPNRFLNMDERKRVETAIEKLANRISIADLDVAKSYDRSKAGDWSRNQFVQFLRAVRVRLEEREMECLMKAFGRTVGGVRYLMYLPMIKAVDIVFKKRLDSK